MSERETIVKLREALKEIAERCNNEMHPLPEDDADRAVWFAMNPVFQLARAALDIPVPWKEASEKTKREAARDMLADMRGEIEG